jgi:putative phage-type endonuclease
MEIVDVVQRSAAWHPWRKTGFSASEAFALLNRDPEKSWWRLWAEKTGRAASPDISRNPYVIRGNRLEARARLCAEMVLGEPFLLPVCARSSQFPLAIASLDGITSLDRPVELKVPAESTYEDVCNLGIASEAYYRYMPQVQQQLIVTNADYGWLLFYNPNDTGDYRIFKVLRDEFMIAEIKQAIASLWKNVETDTPPEKDLTKDTYMPEDDSAKTLWNYHAEQFRMIDAEVSNLKQRMEHLKTVGKNHESVLTELMGVFDKADYAGVSITRVTKKGDVNYKELLSKNAINLSDDEINAHRKQSTTYYRIWSSSSVMPKNITDPVVVEELKNVPDVVVSNYF